MDRADYIALMIVVVLTAGVLVGIIVLINRNKKKIEALETDFIRYHPKVTM